MNTLINQQPQNPFIELEQCCNDRREPREFFLLFRSNGQIQKQCTNCSQQNAIDSTSQICQLSTITGELNYITDQLRQYIIKINKLTRKLTLANGQLIIANDRLDIITESEKKFLFLIKEQSDQFPTQSTIELYYKNEIIQYLINPTPLIEITNQTQTYNIDKEQYLQVLFEEIKHLQCTCNQRNFEGYTLEDQIPLGKRILCQNCQRGNGYNNIDNSNNIFKGFFDEIIENQLFYKELEELKNIFNNFFLTVKQFCYQGYYYCDQVISQLYCLLKDVNFKIPELNQPIGREQIQNLVQAIANYKKNKEQQQKIEITKGLIELFLVKFQEIDNITYELQQQIKLDQYLTNTIEIIVEVLINNFVSSFNIKIQDTLKFQKLIEWVHQQYNYNNINDNRLTIYLDYIRLIQYEGQTVGQINITNKSKLLFKYE